MKIKCVSNGIYIKMIVFDSTCIEVYNGKLSEDFQDLPFHSMQVCQAKKQCENWKVMNRNTRSV